MLVYKSLKRFFLSNIVLFSIGLINHNFIIFFYKNNILNNFIVLFIAYLLRNYILLILVENMVKNRLRISDINSSIPIQLYKYEFDIYLITNTFSESITNAILIPKIINIEYSNNIFNELIYFIPISFIYELVYDFFYYTIHLTLHSKYLYKQFHKLHHKFKHPIGILLYYQHPIDWFTATIFPSIFSLYLLTYVSKISYFQFNMIHIYKTAVEIAGHCGKKIYPVCSFTQFPWLVKYLNIELYSEDHNLHHSLNNCNYGKRFSLWDKVFNTYKNGHEYYLKNINK
jgi:sterol desaturase/sphingolipid hydroxylase (fatty acid hydroxylase superfamily)